MPEIDRHEPGFFSWTDLPTSDLEGAKRFYSGLFGWDIEEQPMGEGDPYVMFKVKGRDVAAAFTQREEQKGQPPAWVSYVTVESADETAEKAKAAGGHLFAEPFDVFDAGRMCVIQDPTGGVLCPWEPRSNIGARLLNEPVSISWNELMTRDTAKAVEFYGKVFGWTTEEQDMGGSGTYTLFKKGDRYVGGMMKMGDEMADHPPFWGVYFEVADCDDTAARTKDLDGEVLVPPQTIPSVGRFACLQDPQKAAFYVITSEPQSV